MEVPSPKGKASTQQSILPKQSIKTGGASIDRNKKIIASADSDENAESEEYQEINENDLESFDLKDQKKEKNKK